VILAKEFKRTFNKRWEQLPTRLSAKIHDELARLKTRAGLMNQYFLKSFTTRENELIEFVKQHKKTVVAQSQNEVLTTHEMMNTLNVFGAAIGPPVAEAFVLYYVGLLKTSITNNDTVELHYKSYTTIWNAFDQLLQANSKKRHVYVTCKQRAFQAFELDLSLDGEIRITFYDPGNKHAGGKYAERKLRAVLSSYAEERDANYVVPTLHYEDDIAQLIKSKDDDITLSRSASGIYIMVLVQKWIMKFDTRVNDGMLANLRKYFCLAILIGEPHYCLHY
jgi:hypothetical protein